MTGIPRDCSANMGGIKRVWIACSDEVTGVTITENQISAITPTDVWKLYEFRKQTGSFSTAITKDDANGTNYYESTIVLQFAKMETAKRLEIISMTISDMKLIIEDNNGHYWLFGYDNPVTLTEGSGATGTAYGDLNGYNVTLMDMSLLPPYEITEGAMAPILNPTVTP